MFNFTMIVKKRNVLLKMDHDFFHSLNYESLKGEKCLFYRVNNLVFKMIQVWEVEVFVTLP